MSILIAYLIIGLTFSLALVITHEHNYKDSVFGYIFGFFAMAIIWPIAIYNARKYKYKKHLF